MEEENKKQLSDNLESEVLPKDEVKERIVCLSDKSGEFIKKELMKLSLVDIRKEFVKAEKYFNMCRAVYDLKRIVD